MESRIHYKISNCIENNTIAVYFLFTNTMYYLIIVYKKKYQLRLVVLLEMHIPINSKRALFEQVSL